MLKNFGITMNNYFDICVKDDDSLGFAYLESERTKEVIYTCHLEVTYWKSPTFYLRGGDYGDFLANDFLCRLCSPRLRQILDSNKGEKDSIEWLPAYVEHSATQQKREYFILIISQFDDVYDHEQSLYINGSISIPVLDRNKVVGHKVFSLPDDFISLMVSEDIKAAIEKIEGRGLKFYQVPVNLPFNYFFSGKRSFSS